MEEGRGVASDCMMEQGMELRSNAFDEALQGTISGVFPSYQLIRLGSEGLAIDLTCFRAA